MSTVIKNLYSGDQVGFYSSHCHPKHYLMHHLGAEIKLVSQAQLLLSLFYEPSEGRLVPL